jgi:hypothetical protein
MKTISEAADRAFRFLAGLNLQDHATSDQREQLEVVREMKHAPDAEGLARGASPTYWKALVELADALTQGLRNLRLSSWVVTVVGDHLEIRNVSPAHMGPPVPERRSTDHRHGGVDMGPLLPPARPSTDPEIRAAVRRSFGD